jgi:hypothetical protein
MRKKKSQSSQESRDPRNLIQREIESMAAVSDQRGWLVTFLGVSLAYLLSSVFVGALSKEKIEIFLKKGMAQMDTDEVSLSFESANLQLRDGLIPKFRLQIQGLRLESKNPCFFSPTITSRVAHFPLSPFRWILGQSPVHQIQIVDAQMRVKTDRSFCKSLQTSQKEQERSDRSTSVDFQKKWDLDSLRKPTQESLGSESSQSLPRSSWLGLQESPLDSILIGKLGLYLDEEHDAFVEVEDLEFNVRFNPPRQVRLWSKVHLFKEQNIQDYFTHGVLSAEYSEQDSKKIKAEIVGHVREGNYALGLILNPDTGDFELKSQLDHVPFAPLLQLLRRFQILEIDFPAKKVWSTFKAEARGNFYSPENVFIQIFPVEISGEMGTLYTREIHVRNLARPQVSPFVITIRKLDVDQIAEQMPRLRLNFIQKYGVFEGAIKVENLQNLTISGLLRNVELIFSNGGRREVQRIRDIIVEGSSEGSSLNMEVSRMDFVDGVFQGRLHYSRNSSGEEAVQIRADELLFSPEVQDVMTAGGFLSPLFFVYNRSWTGRMIHRDELRFLLPQVILYGVRIDGIKGEAHYQGLGETHSKYELGVQAKELLLDPQSPVAVYLSPLPLGKKLPHFLSDLKFEFSIESFDSIQWKNVVARSSEGIYQMEGGWDSHQNLFGSIRLSSNSQKQTWSIQGVRSAPRFSPAVGN